MTSSNINPLIIKRILKMLLLFILNMFISVPIGLLLVSKTIQIQLIWVIVYFLYYFFVLGLAWRFYKQEVPEPSIRFKLRNHKKAIFIGILIMVGMIAYNYGMAGLSQLVYHTNQSANNLAIEHLVKIAHGNWIAIVMITIWMIITAPILEEVIYRGVLPNIYASGIFITAIINGIVFGLNHGLSNIFIFSVYMLMGIVFYLISRYYHSLIPSILMHILNNTIAAIGIILLLMK